MNAIGTQLRDPINSGLTRWRIMAIFNKFIDAAAEFGRNPVSKHQIQQHEYGDEQADAGQHRRTRLARLKNADREILIFPVQLTTSRIGNHTRLIPTLSCYMCDHTLGSTQTAADKPHAKVKGTC